MALKQLGRQDQRGYSFIELLVVSAILLILASAIAPLARTTIQRQREVDLRRALREIRTAIDEYKDAVDLGVIGGANLDSDNQGYPPNLEVLVDGIEPADDSNGRLIKFLRRIPPDPVARDREWGLRSYQDRPDSDRWSGDNVYDVYSKAPGRALDGSRYREW